MSPADIGIWALALPFGVGLVLIAASWPLLGLTGLAGAGRAAAAIGVGGGYLAGHAALAWPSAFPPVDVTDRIPFLVIPAIVLGVLESLWPGSWWTRWENRLIAATAVVVVVLGPLWEGMTADRPGTIRLVAIGLTILASWANLEALAVRVPASALGLSAGITTVGAAVTLLLGGNMVLCTLALSLGASLAAVWAISLRWPTLTLAGGAAPVVATALAALLIDGQFYASPPEDKALAFGGAAVAIVVAPLAAWVARIGPIRRRPAWVACLAVAFATALPVALAIVLALKSGPEPISY